MGAWLQGGEGFHTCGRFRLDGYPNVNQTKGMSDTIRSIARNYATPDDKRAWIELLVSLALYLIIGLAALFSIGNWLLTIPLMMATAGMALRIYMIQHDCLHRAFFSSRKVNDIVGKLVSPIAMTPYEITRYKHNLHHSHVSDLDRRDTFEIYVMTHAEWDKASPLQRLGYRIYRSPITLILLGPYVVYLIFRRCPPAAWKVGFGDLIIHDLMIAAMIWGIWAGFGWTGVGVWAGTVWMGTAFGALIPYVVHNFEHIHWGTKPEMDYETACLDGASVLDWGRFFDLLMLNIGYHDLHHLNARIPGYKLKAAHQALEAKGLIASQKIGFIEGIGCLRWKLYDEDRQRMTGFPRRFWPNRPQINTP